MKVGLITSTPLVPPWDQGDKNLAYALTSALPHVEFRVLTTRSGPTPVGENLESQRLYRSNHPSLAEKIRVYSWFLLSGRHSPPDLFHLVYQPSGLSSRFVKWLPGFQRTPSVHTVPATTEGHPLHSSLFFADRVVAMSEHGRRALRCAGLDNVAYIPQGIKVDEWTPLHSQTDRLKSHLDVGGKRVVLYPGHFSSGYGIHVLMRAFPEIASRVLDVQLILACRLRSPGDREREKVIQKTMMELGLSRMVRFYHTVSDMRTLIGASDLVVSPFRTMRDKVDIPTTLLESLAAGKPIVVSDIPPMNELVNCEDTGTGRDGVGLTVPPGNAEALADAVVFLLKEKELREQMGRRGQALVRDRFDIQQMARQYEEVYREMVQ